METLHLLIASTTSCQIVSVESVIAALVMVVLMVIAAYGFYRLIMRYHLITVGLAIAIFVVMTGLYYSHPVECSEQAKQCTACECVKCATTLTDEKNKLENGVVANDLTVWGWNNSFNLNSFMSAICRTASAFFPSRGGYESLPNSTEYGLLYYALHFIVLFYVACLGLSLFGRQLVDVAMIQWYRLWKYERYAFWGDSEEARTLAKDILKKRKKAKAKIIFLLAGSARHEDGFRTSVRQLVDMGFHIQMIDKFPSCDAESLNHRVWDSVKLPMAKSFGTKHFIFGENSTFNAMVAKAVAKSLEGRSADIYVRIENWANNGLRKGWMSKTVEWINSINVDKTAADKFIRLHFVRETELMASKFIGDYPLLGIGNSNLSEARRINSNYETGIANGETRLLIIGFGNRGQELLNIHIENGQFLGANGKPLPFSATIVDAEAKSYVNYTSRSPEVESTYNLGFVKLDATSVDFDNYIGKDGFIDDYNRILVCTGDDEKNIAIAKAICRRFASDAKPVPKGLLFVQLQSKAKYDCLHYLEKDDEGEREVFVAPFENVVFFGMWDDIFTYDEVVNEYVDLGARLLNWRYNYGFRIMVGGKERSVSIEDIGTEVVDIDDEKKEPKMVKSVDRSWAGTSWFDRESSMASFRGERNILALFGLRFGETDKSTGNSINETWWLIHWRKLIRHLQSRGIVRQSRVAASQSATQFSEYGRKIKSVDIKMRMAENEHLRWMAFMRTHGVTKWDLTMPSMEDVFALRKEPEDKLKAKAIDTIGRHAAMIDFDLLPDVDLAIARFNATKDNATKEKDNKKCYCREDFVGEGKGYGLRKGLQWNDIKFVNWIPDLTAYLKNPEGKQIVICKAS